MTTKTWEPGTAPTPAQWLDWLTDLDRGEQLIAAQRVLVASETASRCLQHQHEATIDAVTAERDDLAEQLARVREALQ